MKRIFSVLISLIVLLTMISLFNFSDFRLTLFIFLSATTGVVMGISYPFTLLVKLLLISGLIIAMVSIIYGFLNHKFIKGQTSATLGFIVWSGIGLIGLSTGT